MNLSDEMIKVLTDFYMDHKVAIVIHSEEIEMEHSSKSIYTLIVYANKLYNPTIQLLNMWVREFEDDFTIKVEKEITIKTLEEIKQNGVNLKEKV